MGTEMPTPFSLNWVSNGASVLRLSPLGVGGSSQNLQVNKPVLKSQLHLGKLRASSLVSH